MRNRATTVRFPVFNGYEVQVICARSVKQTGRRLGTDLSDALAAFVYPDPKKPKHAWLVLGPAPDEATIAHEASHAVRALLAYVGAKNDNETFAYHLDYLVGRIHRFLKGKKCATQTVPGEASQNPSRAAASSPTPILAESGRSGTGIPVE